MDVTVVEEIGENIGGPALCSVSSLIIMLNQLHVVEYLGRREAYTPPHPDQP